MLARLILFLLLVVAAVPGMAAGQGCHEQVAGVTAPMAAMPDMPAHHDHGAPAEHRCIGCMPLPDAPRSGAMVAAPHVRLPRPVPAQFDLRAAGPPALPPPRIG